ncbi:MAG: metallophosphoesterase, partial [Chitinophagaceae bacterium]|nr:metallophosphoesterase [Chitinophagaceae bacterium]
MSLFRLLHTTDWHIFDPNRKEEKLRKGFYKDYINGLYAKVKEQGLERIDLLVCSGDFIDRGTVQNFDHAKVVLDYLLEKFELNPDQIITTVGNHDIHVLDPSHGDMSAYQAFIAHYKPKKIIFQDSIHQIVEYPNKVYVVELNSVFNAEGSIHTDSTNKYIVKPCILTDESIDLVVNNVQTYVSQPNLIIIVSHFPLSINARAEQITEEPNWVEKQLWKQGKFIMQRITNHRLNDNIVCLCG